MPSSLRASVLLLVLASGCATAHEDGRDAAIDAPGTVAPGADGGVVGPGVDSGLHGIVDPTGDSGLVDTGVPRGVAVCGGVACAPGQECCLLDLRCVDRGDPSCVPPPGSPAGACATGSDCPDGQACEVLDARGAIIQAACQGLGRCDVVQTGCGGWDLPGVGVCGCDGRDYAGPCVASAARVRIVAYVPCGEFVVQGGHSCSGGTWTCLHGHCDDTPGGVLEGSCIDDDPLFACGTDGDCPAGQTCCRYTGLCFAPERAAVCAPAPTGTFLTCLDDSDCQRYTGEWYDGPITSTPSYCDAPTCSGPGGCRFAPTTCGTEIAKVCGCDGNTYDNACLAGRARVRVAHTGGC